MKSNSSVYDMRTNAMTNPMGVDDTPLFSWKTKAKRHGAYQTSYRILVSLDAEMSKIIWDSGIIKSDQSIGIAYGGKLEPMTRYFWRVWLTDENGAEYKSGVSFFETGLMGKDGSVWNGAQWICAPIKTHNTAAVLKYSVAAELKTDTQSGIVIAARNKDSYTLIKTDIENKTLTVLQHDEKPVWNAVKKISEDIVSTDWQRIQIDADVRKLTVYINGVKISDFLLPPDEANRPRRLGMMSVGFLQENGETLYKNIKIIDGDTVLQQFDQWHTNGLLSILGEVRGEILAVKDSFELICPVPPFMARKIFYADKNIKSARLYASARGFYEIYINGEKADDSFYNPGFTEYGRRIQYQTYDITDKIKIGENTLSVIVAKGYWSGFCGYSGAQIYGEQNAFLCMAALDYTDGGRDFVITDTSWEYTDKTPVIDADYLDGETYDARIKPDCFSRCGTQKWVHEAHPVNGEFKEVVKFELSAEKGPAAKIETVLKPQRCGSDFIYDFGQNMVGTVRLRVRGKRGAAIKIQYGEMVDKDGGLYTKNLRTAACTDVYTLCGSADGEEFLPSLTSHGFRYAKISGCGFELRDEVEILGIEGLVINNIIGITGGFECSNEDINKLQKNIVWGGKGNSLLVFTDCPQRNERMGWTGDIQVFAKTGAYNMDINAFSRKWLLDVADSQLVYNKNGAVPDTAPLGGDNRPDGCGGWGDAAVIVPWELYMAYGDENILRENYNTMAGWIEYQSSRENCGERTVNGKIAPSDLASAPYIQMQQRRGDHLAYDITTPYILSATAYAAHVSDIMSKTAQILKKDADAEKYRNRFNNIKRAFNEAWVKADGSIGYWGEMSLSDKTKTSWGERGVDKNGNSINATYYCEEEGSGNYSSQTAYALAIDFGLIDADKIKCAGKYLKKAVERNGGLISVGFLGISHILPALQKAGFINEAYALLEKTENPSWLYSVKNGATTIWERWDSYIAETGEFGDTSMNSFNHYAYGAAGEWLFGCAAGINAAAAGYKKILLTPHIAKNMTYAKAWHESPYGMIKSEWKKCKDKILYKCEIPANTTAELVLPNGITHALQSGEYEFEI